MTRMAVAAFIGVLLLDPPVVAKTADQLKSELAALLPQGKKVRVAWGQGSPNSSVYVVDSDNGVVRELTPASLFASSRNIKEPFITRDGQKVAFVEENSSAVYVINWEGTDLRKLLSSGCIAAPWQHPDSLTQWIVVNINGSSRISVDNPAVRAPVHTWDACAFNGISVDGKRIGGFLCERAYWTSGIAATPNGAPVCNDCGGCNFSMRPTTGVYEYCHFVSGHAAIHVHNADGSAKETADMTSTVKSWSEANPGFSTAGTNGPMNLKFTSHPDYVIYRYDAWRVNPVLFQLSTKKWAGMRDDLQGIAVGDADAVFFGPTTVPVRSAEAARFAPSAGQNALYTLTGRRCASAPKSNHGDAGVNGVVICLRNGAAWRALRR